MPQSNKSKSQSQSQSDSTEEALSEPLLPKTRTENAPVLVIRPKFEVWQYVIVKAGSIGEAPRSSMRPADLVYGQEIGRVAVIDRPEPGKYRYLVGVTERGAQSWFLESELEAAPKDYIPTFY